MNISIVLIHNKSDKENFDQIEYFKPLIVLNTQDYPEIFNPISNKLEGAYQRYFYTLKGLNIPHEVFFYQIIPFGVTPPDNLYDLDSHKVFYGKGDEDKIENHPRFFNWGLKRGTDYGADIVVHIDDYKSFSIDDLPFKLNTLFDPTDELDFIHENSAKYSTLRLLKTVGQVNENNYLDISITSYKQKIIAKGLKHG